MTLNANRVPSSGGFRQPVLEPGPYPARIVQILDLGLQPMSYMGQDKDPTYKINVTYELLDEYCVDEDGNVQEDKPRWISEEFPLYSLRAERAKSTERYKALDPQNIHDGDWSQLLGTPCTVTVVNNPGKGKNEGRVFNNVGNVSPMRAKDAENASPLVNDSVFLDLEQPDVEVFNSLPDYLKDKIQSNLEYQGSALQNLLDGVQSEQQDTVEDDVDYMSEDQPESFE